MWTFIVEFIVGGFKALFGGGAAKAAPKPADVVSEQAATTPALAATAARDEQTVADVKAAQTAQEAGNDQVRVAAAIGDSVRADGLRDSSQANVYADDGFRRD